MSAGKCFFSIFLACVFVTFSHNGVGQSPGSTIPQDPSAVLLAAVCPKAQIGEFRHGTKCTGYYAENRLVDIQLAGRATSTEFVSTKSLVHAGVDLIAPE